MRKYYPFVGIFVAVMGALFVYDKYKEYQLKQIFEKQLEDRYQASKRMDIQAFPKSTEFPIPVFKKPYEPLMQDAKPIAYIDANEEITYLQKESSAYLVRLNQKTFKGTGYISIKFEPGSYGNK